MSSLAVLETEIEIEIEFLTLVAHSPIIMLMFSSIAAIALPPVDISA